VSKNELRKRHLKNLPRILIGKEPIDTAKGPGMLAKSIAAPYKAEKAIMLGISRLADAMGKRLEQLETTAAKNREGRGREPGEATLLGELAEAKGLVEQRKLEQPIKERPKTKAAEI
jgi:hypothetical protein